MFVLTRSSLIRSMTFQFFSSSSVFYCAKKEWKVLSLFSGFFILFLFSGVFVIFIWPLIWLHLLGLLVWGIGPFHGHLLSRLTQKNIFLFSRLAGFESQNSDDCAVLSQRAFLGLYASILVGIIGIFVILIIIVVIIIIATTTTTTTTTTTITVTGSQGSVVGIVTRRRDKLPRNRGSIPRRTKRFLFSRAPRPLFNEHRTFFPQE